MSPVWLDAPDKPGWWAFEGSEWDALEIYLVKGVEYRGWQEEWTERAEEYWHQHELNLYEPVRYERVPSEPFQTIVEVKWIREGQTEKTLKHHGRHEGEPTLGFSSPKYTWDSALHTSDTWTGKWCYLEIFTQEK